VSFTISFPTQAPTPALAELGAWVAEEGEAFTLEAETAEVVLRALPLRLAIASGAGVRATVEAGSSSPISRTVRVVFALAARLGADVRLVGTGLVDRAALWLRLADEQDRLRLALALARAEDHPQGDEILRGLWSVLAALAPERAVRWDTLRERVVELRELVDDPDASSPDTVPVPLDPPVHLVAWRWLAETWPTLADPRGSP
jgi:hypothetical protein